MDDPEDSENRLYARRQYSTIRQMKSGLPNIPGMTQSYQDMMHKIISSARICDDFLVLFLESMQRCFCIIQD